MNADILGFEILDRLLGRPPDPQPTSASWAVFGASEETGGRAT